MPNLVQIVLGYVVLLAPQIYEALQQYQATHPSPALAIIVSLLGGVLLHKASPGK